MVKQITDLFVHLIQSYWFIIVLALGAGLLVPESTRALAPYATLFLQIIFFLTSLKMDPKEIWKEARRPRVLITVNLFMLLICPAVVYLVAQAVVPSMAVALMLLAAMPTGMTAPLLTDVVGGRPGLSLVLTITTSLLAPLTVPLMVSLFAGTAVTVGFWSMFWGLIKVIVIPFVLAQLVRFWLHPTVKASYFAFKPISLVLLGLLIAGIVANQADVIMLNLGSVIPFQLLVLFIFITILLVLGYFVIFWRNGNDRLTIAVSLTFMNFTLAIYIAGTYFEDPAVLLATVLVIFPWTIMLLPFKWVSNSLLRRPNN